MGGSAPRRSLPRSRRAPVTDCRIQRRVAAVTGFPRPSALWMKRISPGTGTARGGGRISIKSASPGQPPRDPHLGCLDYFVQPHADGGTHTRSVPVARTFMPALADLPAVRLSGRAGSRKEAGGPALEGRYAAINSGKPAVGKPAVGEAGTGSADPSGLGTRAPADSGRPVRIPRKILRITSAHGGVPCI